MSIPVTADTANKIIIHLNHNLLLRSFFCCRVTRFVCLKEFYGRVNAIISIIFAGVYESPTVELPLKDRS